MRERSVRITREAAIPSPNLDRMFLLVAEKNWSGNKSFLDESIILGSVKNAVRMNREHWRLGEETEN